MVHDASHLRVIKPHIELGDKRTIYSGEPHEFIKAAMALKQQIKIYSWKTVVVEISYLKEQLLEGGTKIVDLKMPWHTMKNLKAAMRGLSKNTIAFISS